MGLAHGFRKNRYNDAAFDRKIAGRPRLAARITVSRLLLRVHPGTHAG
jgi:hypothetical protein